MKKPIISLIAAIGKNRELGKDNKLLWHIPEDLARFKKLTSGRAVIIGRKTFESIGKPLPNRMNIIITHDVKKFIEKNFQNSLPSVMVFSSFEKAINFIRSKEFLATDNPLLINKNEVFVIGGASVYQQGLKYADKLYLTIIDKEFPEADTFFPNYSEFKKVVFQEKGRSKKIQFSWIVMTR